MSGFTVKWIADDNTYQTLALPVRKQPVYDDTIVVFDLDQIRRVSRINLKEKPDLLRFYEALDRAG